MKQEIIPGKKAFYNFWQTHCTKEKIGYALIAASPLITETSCDIALIWAENEKLKTKVISLLVVTNQKNVEFVYTLYEGNYDASGKILSKKTFGRVPGSKFKDKIFSTEIRTLVNPNNLSKILPNYLSKRVADIEQTGGFKLCAECLNNRPLPKLSGGGKRQIAAINSVFTTSGGLPGLGKNRKH